MLERNKNIQQNNGQKHNEIVENNKQTKPRKKTEQQSFDDIIIYKKTYFVMCARYAMHSTHTQLVYTSKLFIQNKGSHH